MHRELLIVACALLLLPAVAGDIEKLTVEDCTAGSCSVANWNSNTTSIGATIAKNSQDILNMTAPSALGGSDTINSVSARVRYSGNTGISGELELYFHNDADTTAYCQDTSHSLQAGDTEYTSTPSGCSWTLARLQDLSIDFFNGDDASPTSLDGYYIDVVIDYTASNDPPTWTNELVVNQTVDINDGIQYNATGTDPDSDNYRLTVCRTATINNGYPGTCAASQELCNSTATSSGSQASCTYTTTASDEGTLTGFGYLCDEGSSTCTNYTSNTTTINPVYGYLNNTITLPTDNTAVDIGSTFTLTVTVECSGPADAKCGNVTALPRFNASATTPDTAMLTTLITDSPTFEIGSVTNTSRQFDDLNNASLTTAKVSADGLTVTLGKTRDLLANATFVYDFDSTSRTDRTGNGYDAIDQGGAILNGTLAGVRNQGANISTTGAHINTTWTSVPVRGSFSFWARKQVDANALWGSQTSGGNAFYTSLGSFPSRTGISPVFVSGATTVSSDVENAISNEAAATHIVILWDLTIPDIEVWSDGTNISSTTSGSAITSPYELGSAFCLGLRCGVNNNGIVTEQTDEVAMFNRKLNSSEIALLYKSGNAINHTSYTVYDTTENQYVSTNITLPEVVGGAYIDASYEANGGSISFNISLDGDTTSPSYASGTNGTIIAAPYPGDGLIIGAELTGTNATSPELQNISLVFVLDSTDDDLQLGENYNFTWVVNFTGAEGESYEVDVLFNSTTYDPTIAHNDTADRTVLNATGGGGDPCACPGSGDWTISDGSTCTLTTTCDLGVNQLLITNGALHITTGSLLATGCYVKDGEALYTRDGGVLYCRT